MMGRKLKWGILGTAEIAKIAVIPAIQQSERGEVLGIASRNADKSAEAAQEFDIPKSYGSYEELLADPEIGAVYIRCRTICMKSGRSGPRKRGSTFCAKNHPLLAQPGQAA